MLQINTEKVKGKDLNPGDLFSTAGPDYWDLVSQRGTEAGLPVGERVYIRTEAAPPPGDDMEVFRLTINRR